MWNLNFKKIYWHIVVLQCCVKFLLYGKMNHLCIYMYPLFFGFPSLLSHQSI